MRLKEYFVGNQTEQQVLQTAADFRNRPDSKSSLAKTRAFENADIISRRLFLRRATVVGSGLVIGAALPVGVVLQDVLKGESDPYFESTYNHYLEGFEKVATGNAEAQEYLSFFKERRKQGRFENGDIITMETGDSLANFYTAIIDPNKNKKDFDSMPGFSVYRNSTEPTFLLLKNVPLTPVWAGALLTHESTHVYQWLNGIEQQRPDGFIQGEVDAYTLEFSTLDRVTSGKFREALLKISGKVKDLVSNGAVNFINNLSDEEFDSVNVIFPKLSGEDEYSLRYADYLMGANFALIEDRAKDSSEEAGLKTYFTQLLMGGKFGFLPNCAQKCVA